MTQLSYYDDDGDSATFTLLSTGAPFSLTAGGLLYVDTSKGWLNYELTNAYSLSIGLREVSNKGTTPLLWSAQGNVSQGVSVVDVNEYPYFSILPNGYKVDEESVYPMEVTAYTTSGFMITTVNPWVTVSYNGTFVYVNDEDGGNNSALVVSVTSVSGSNSSYFEVVNATTGGACRGGQNCTLRIRQGSPRINYDAPDSLSWINVTLTVTDPTGLATNTSAFNVTINDVNQREHFVGCWHFVHTRLALCRCQCRARACQCDWRVG